VYWGLKLLQCNPYHAPGLETTHLIMIQSKKCHKSPACSSTVPFVITHVPLDLRPNTSLSITIGILPRVQSVQEASLLRASSSGGGVVVVVVVVSSSSCSASGTGSRSSKPAVNSSWLSLESVIALLAAGEATSLLFEVSHADGWEGGSGVVLGFIDVGLVDGDGGVYYGGLDSLFLNDGLNGLVNVVVNMLAGNDGSN